MFYFFLLVTTFGRFILAELVFRTNGKASLLTIFTLLVEQFGKRILQRLIIVFAIAEYVDGGVDGLTHGLFVGLALSGYVVGGTMIGRCTYDR